MEPPATRRIELILPIRTILVIMGAIALMAAFAAIGDSFLIVFVGIFLALVFEYPTRFVMAKTRMSRGLAATVTVIGAALAVFVLALLLLVPLVGSVRDYLQELPETVQKLQDSGELSWLGDSGVGRERAGRRAAGREDGADAISAVLGVAGSFFSIFLASFTILFVCLFLLSDIGNLKRSLASVLMPGDDERWLGVWERVTASISRWAIGVVVIAAIAGTTQGMTAWLLGSSYAVALGVIAGLLDMIPNIGATIAGFILVPTLWAEEGLTAALIMLAVVLVYQQVENSILTPKIQGKAVSLSPFFIIVAVSLFGALLGVLGALTAVPLAATIQIFLQELTKSAAGEGGRGQGCTDPDRRRAAGSSFVSPVAGAPQAQAGRPEDRASHPGGPSSCVLGVVCLPRRVLGILLREEAVDERHPDQDRDHRRQVCPLVAVEEGGLGGRRDLGRVLRVLRGEILGARDRRTEVACVGL